MKLTKNLIALLTGLAFAHITFAAETVAKEETTPPTAAGALNPDQIRPIDSAAMNKTTAPPAPAPAPTATVAPALTAPVIAPSAPVAPAPGTVPATTPAPAASSGTTAMPPSSANPGTTPMPPMPGASTAPAPAQSQQ